MQSAELGHCVAAILRQCNRAVSSSQVKWRNHLERPYHSCENQDQQSPPLQILLPTARQDHHALLLSPGKSFPIKVPSHHADDKYSLRLDFLTSLPEQATILFFSSKNEERGRPQLARQSVRSQYDCRWSLACEEEKGAPKEERLSSCGRCRN